MVFPEMSDVVALATCTALGAAAYIMSVRLFAPDLFAYALGLFNQAFGRFSRIGA